MIVNYLPNNKIDYQRWDDCMVSASNGRIYALSWYLDQMCPNWSALITADYKFIMPLPIRRKWGLKYIFQPAFTQQLGIFSREECSSDVSTLFIERLKENFNYAEINFNSDNKISHQHEFTFKKNYLLSIDTEYQILQNAFSRSAKRNIAKAIEHNVKIEESKDADILLSLHQQRYGSKLTSPDDLAALKELLHVASTKGIAYFLYAKNKDGDYIASSAYLQFKDRVIFLVNGNLQEGLDCGATHLLKSYAIKKFCNAGLVMDFEGSETPAFARFYEQYGAKRIENYPFFKLNNLPYFIKLFKK